MGLPTFEEETIDNFVNGNKKDFLKGAKEIKEKNLENDFLNYLSTFNPKMQKEILEYFFKYS